MGYELAMRFTKGKHAFVVATHTDRQHPQPCDLQLHSVGWQPGSSGFFLFGVGSAAVERPDLLKHQLSVIEKKPYRGVKSALSTRRKRAIVTAYAESSTQSLQKKPGDYETFSAKGWSSRAIRRSVERAHGGKGQGAETFIRFQTLGTGYGEEEIKAVLEGKAKHQPYQKQPPKEQPFQLLVDIQGKMAEGKSVGYKKWATKFNLKEMSKTLLFLQEQKISSAEELRERAAAATERYHAMGDSIKAAEARLTEIAVLKTHIINYAKTRGVRCLRKAGYSKKPFWKPTGRRSPCTRRRKLPLTKQGFKSCRRSRSWMRSLQNC